MINFNIIDCFNLRNMLRLFAFCREKLNNLVKDDDGIIFFVMGEYNAAFFI